MRRFRGVQAASLHSSAACRRKLCSAGCRTPQASCLRSPSERNGPGNTGAVLSLILLVTAETELGKFRLSFLYPYPGHRLAVRPVGHIAHLAAEPGIE